MTQLYSVRFHQPGEDMKDLEDGCNQLRGTGADGSAVGPHGRAAAPDKIDDCIDALRRVQAEFENYPKRVRRQQGQEAERGVER